MLSASPYMQFDTSLDFLQACQRLGHEKILVKIRKANRSILQMHFRWHQDGLSTHNRSWNSCRSGMLFNEDQEQWLLADELSVWYTSKMQLIYCERVQNGVPLFHDQHVLENRGFQFAKQSSSHWRSPKSILMWHCAIGVSPCTFTCFWEKNTGRYSFVRLLADLIGSICKQDMCSHAWGWSITCTVANSDLDVDVEQHSPWLCTSADITMTLVMIVPNRIFWLSVTRTAIH